MSNIEKVNQFLNEAKVFYFLTTDGDQPKGRPFGFHIMDDGKLFFGTGTFKKVYQQLLKNPKVEIIALNGPQFMRYDGTVKIVESEELLDKVRQVNNVMKTYDKNGWTMGMFYLENGHVEIIQGFDVVEEFDC